MRSGKRILLGCVLALAPCAVAAEENPFHLKDTREAFEHPSVPQEVPDGLTVKFRLGKGGPLVESKHLNGRFDRVEETAKLLDKDGYPLERQAAVQELARYPGEPTVYALIPALRDINPFVRERAAVALGDMGDVRAIRPLIDMLGYSDHGRAEVAARALEKITGVQNLGASLEAWETWWEAYRKWPHGIGTPKKSGP